MQFAVYIEDILKLTRAHSTCQIHREPKLSPEVPYLEETEQYFILNYYFNAICLTINIYYSKRWFKKKKQNKPTQTKNPRTENEEKKISELQVPQ